MGVANSKQEAFWEACGFGHTIKVKKFLQEGIDVNWVSFTHNSCAIHVASQGKTEIVKMLIEAKCDVNVKDDRECLPIHHAAMKGFAEIITILLNSKSELNPLEKNGWSPLVMAAYWCQPSAVEVLLKRGCDIHLKNKDERTALHECARSPSDEEDDLGKIAAMLIEAGCDINAKSSDLGEADFTPLMFACYHGHIEVARALVKSGCLIDAQGTNGWSALHWASDRNREDVVKFLLESGIDPTLKGRRGELAVDRAKSNEVRQLFPVVCTPEKEDCPSLPEIETLDKDQSPSTPTAETKPSDDTTDMDLPVSDPEVNHRDCTNESMTEKTAQENEETLPKDDQGQDYTASQEEGATVSDVAADDTSQKEAPMVADDVGNATCQEEGPTVLVNQSASDEQSGGKDEIEPEVTSDKAADTVPSESAAELELPPDSAVDHVTSSDSVADPEVPSASTGDPVTSSDSKADCEKPSDSVAEPTKSDEAEDFTATGMEGSDKLEGADTMLPEAAKVDKPDDNNDIDDLLAGIENVNLTQYLVKRSISKSSSLTAEETPHDEKTSA